MENKKRGQAGIIPALIIILGSLVFVSAVVTNSTNDSLSNFNESLNITIADVVIDETINESNTTNITLPISETIQNQTLENITLTNETTNLTQPKENLTVNQSINLTLPLTNESINTTLNNTINNQIINVTLPTNITAPLNGTNFTINGITNQTINNTIVLAKIYNEDLLDFDRDYRLKYLNDHKNFSNINFIKVINREDSTLTVGARNDNVKGFAINNQSYAVHLLYCISHKRYCTFRINGIPTKKLFSYEDFGNSKKHSFDLDENYIIKINSVKFDYCDGRTFCHLGMEGYHVVNVSIERKG